MTRELGLEGVVAKRVDSVYQPGRRGHTWVKIKHILTQEVVIVGWTPGENARSGTLGALLMAVPVRDGRDAVSRLSYVGRVGTGFTDQDLVDARTVLSEIGTAAPPLDDVPKGDAKVAHWVEPLLVGEVSYGVWTSVGRLRMPVWRGWRPDKTPTTSGSPTSREPPAEKAGRVAPNVRWGRFRVAQPRVSAFVSEPVPYR